MNKFTKEFREKAIKLKKNGKHPNEIFTENNIDISSKQKDYACKLISHWSKKKKPVKLTQKQKKN